MSRIIFHIDVNSAYLSWSAVDRLEHGETLDIRTVPAIIGGDSATRHGVVLAKSVPAKAYKIVTGEPVANALRKCPTLMLVPPNHAMYHEKSHALMELLHTYTDDIEQLSVDECFLDFTPIAHRYESPLAAAKIISADIKSRFGFTVNIGIAPNKLLAKMASDFTKPDRIHTLFPDEIATKMWPLPVDDLYMVGHSSATRLKALGIRTIGELAATDPDYLRQEFKSHGTLMWEYANGIGDDHVHSTKREAKGIGNSTTLKEDARTLDAAKKVLLSLAESVSMRLRKEKMLAQSITVEIRYHDFTNTSHQCSLLSATNTTDVIYHTAVSLFQQLWNSEPVRLLGIRTSRLLPEDAPVQLSIFDYAADTPASIISPSESTVSGESTASGRSSSDRGASDKISGEKTTSGRSSSESFSSDESSGENPASDESASGNPDSGRAFSGSTLSNNNKKSYTQMPSANKQKQLDAAIDSIRKRFGSKALVRGSFLPSPESDPKKNRPSD